MHYRHTGFFLVAIVFAIAFAFSTSECTAQITVTWSGGTGDWSNSLKWSPNGVPNNAGSTYDVEIDGGLAGASTVTLDQNATIDTLDVSTGDELMIDNGNTLNIAQGTVINDGTITIGGTNGDTGLIVSDGSQISGSGIINLTSQAYSVLGSAVDGESFTVGSNQSITGQGRVGLDQSAIINNGTIEATTGTLRVDPGTGGVINNGFLRSSGTAALVLNDGAWDNTGGTIDAGDGSTVNLNGAIITGGILSSSGTGKIRVDGFNFGTNGGLAGTITNNSTFEVGGTNSTTTLTMGNGTVLNGSGRIEMTAQSYSEIVAGNPGDSFTNGTNHTISGLGSVGLDTTAIINNGTIEARGKGGQNGSGWLSLDPGSGGITNNGLIRSTFFNDGDNNVGTLRLSDAGTGGVIDNTNGEIRAEDGSIIQFRGGIVSGGMLTSTGNGKFEVVNGQQGTIAGSVTNESLIEIGGSNSATILSFAPNAVIDGPGEIEMLSTFRSRITTAGANDMFTNGASHLIHGNGRIGNGHGNMLNLGTIDADNSSLRINPAMFENQGTVQASAGVLIIDNSYSQTAGLTLLDGGTINASTQLDIFGGVLEGDGIINGDVALGGLIRPGVSGTQFTGGAAGTLRMDALNMSSSAITEVELGGLAQGTEFDYIDVDSNLDLDGVLSLSFFDSFESTVMPLDSFTIMLSNTLTGAFTNVASGDFLLTDDGFGSFQVHYGTGSPFDDNSVVLGNYSAIPEPSAAWVLALATLGLPALRRRRRRSVVA
ncbi:MAG: beta strand repeat-containing protein [Pirellulaceae bacterium]